MEIKINNVNIDNKISLLFSYRNSRKSRHLFAVEDIWVIVLGRSMTNDLISLFSEVKVPGPTKLYLK